jgi:hypothetical protein
MGLGGQPLSPPHASRSSGPRAWSGRRFRSRSAHPRRAEAPDRTRVELEHRNLDRHGPDWESERDGVGGDQGWPLYLERFAEKVNA